MTTYTVLLPWKRPPLSLNDRHHWAVKARLTRKTRTEVALLARHIPHCEQVELVLHWRPRDNRRRDQDNPISTVKVCADALKDVGVLDEDDRTRVLSHAVRIHDAVAGEPARMWLEIRDLTAQETPHADA